MRPKAGWGTPRRTGIDSRRTARALMMNARTRYSGKPGSESHEPVNEERGPSAEQDQSKEKEQAQTQGKCHQPSRGVGASEANEVPEPSLPLSEEYAEPRRPVGEKRCAPGVGAAGCTRRRPARSDYAVWDRKSAGPIGSAWAGGTRQGRRS